MNEPCHDPAGTESRLALLAETAGDLALTLDLEATLAAAVERVTRTLDAEGGAMFLVEGDGRSLRCVASWGAVSIKGLVLRSDQGVIGRCIRTGVGEIVRDVASDPGFNPSIDQQTGFTTRSILCAPMRVKDHRVGGIELVNKVCEDGLFTDADLSTLEVLGTAAGLAIINARMAQALVEQERARRELELAAEIQRSLLPRAREASYPVHGVNRPARTVSGDFYDFFPVADGRIGFCLGDVSGKGVNAALLMAKTASLVRCLGRGGMEPGRLFARLNAEIRETATRGMFVTMIGGLYDPLTGTVRIANAGQEPALIVRGGQVIGSVPADAPPLGLPPEVHEPDTIPERTLALDGAALIAFSDGVSEGLAGSDGGDGLLRRLLAATADMPAPDRIESLADRATGTGVVPRDDLTLLIVDDGLRVFGQQPGPRSERLHRATYRASAPMLRRIRETVRACCEASGLDPAAAADVVLAVSEACQNVIRHAYGGDDKGDMVLEICRSEDSLTVLVRDFAPTVDPAAIRPRDLAEVRPGGIGTHIMREIMDEVVYLVPPEGGNLLKLVKRFEGGLQK